MSYRNDLKGKIFGALTVIDVSHQKNRRTYWMCQCSCGNTKAFGRDKLTTGVAVSCGCLSNHSGRFKTKHGASNSAKGGRPTVEYSTWLGIKDRCNNPKNSKYARYGGRGIKMCDKWSESFQSFLDDVGKRPKNKSSIDRIDVNRGYEPGNVRWATQLEQMKNTSKNRIVYIGGVGKPVAEWCHINNLDPEVAYGRLARCRMSEEDAVTLPKRKISKKPLL